MKTLSGLDSPLSVECSNDGQKIMKTFYIKNGRELYFIYNNERRDNIITVKHKSYSEATLLDPSTGEINVVKMNDELNIPSLRGIFLYFDK
jgi:hypothetical protein